jgi:oligosaccharide repeat unit polymerase
MSLFLCMLLLAVCGAGRFLHGSWASPATVFSSVWAVACIPAVVTFPEFVSPLAVFLVLSFALAALMGGVAASTFSTKPRAPPDNAEDDMTRGFDSFASMLLLLGACGLGAAAYYLLNAGFSLSEFGALETWVKLAVENSIARYRGETEPFAIRLLVSFNYAGALLSGMSFGRRCTRAVRFVSLLPLFASVLITVFTTAKTPTMISFLFAFAAWLAVRASDRPAVAQVRWRARISFFFIMALLGAALVGSLALRYGESADAALLTSRMIGYIFGQMPAMSAWLAVDDWANAPPTLGAYTFAGAFELLGIARREQGLYEPIGLNEWAAETNVFSALRGLIMDFGLPVAWLLIAMVAGAAQACWQRLRVGLGGGLARLGLIAFYGFALWSPVVSIFGYNVVWLAFAVCALLMPLFTRISHSAVSTALPGSRK